MGRNNKVAVTLLLVFVGLLFMSRTFISSSPAWNVTPDQMPESGYVTIIDAGSSGSRAHVFSFVKSDTVSIDPDHESFKVRPGLSTFEEKPEDAGPSLEPLLDFMREQIPEAERESSPVYLKATAGLRMIDSEAIMESVRAFLKDSEFKFESAEVISGSEEGGFGWISANYLLTRLEGPWVGVIEMGGASAQVTQMHKPPVLRGSKLPEGNRFQFMDYDLYAQSYLGYGLEQARVTLTNSLKDNNDPCLNKGYEGKGGLYDGERTGNSAWNLCLKSIEAALFQETECEYVSCSRMGAYQPPDLVDAKLVVFENFYYTAQDMNIDATAKAADYVAKGKQACNSNWDDLAAKFPDAGDDLVKLCFSAAYLDRFLELGLGIPADKLLTVQQFVQGNEIDWALGAAIHEAHNLFKS